MTDARTAALEDEKRGKELCINCEKDCSRHHVMCDEETGDVCWCPNCFEKTACYAGVHGEGCATHVFSDGEPP